MSESSEKYQRLDDYAREKGLPPSYLRGAIYYLAIKLPVMGNGYVVDGKGRAKLDPIAEKILDGLESQTNGNGRRGPRRRETKTDAVA